MPLVVVKTERKTETVESGDEARGQAGWTLSKPRAAQLFDGAPRFDTLSAYRLREKVALPNG